MAADGWSELAQRLALGTVLGTLLHQDLPDLATFLDLTAGLLAQ